MTARRLRAPASDGGLLVDPAAITPARLAADNARHLAAWDYDVQGRSAARLRDLARREVVGRARAFLSDHGLDAGPALAGSLDDESTRIPFIVTGHQPELFHPGVWVKNFAAAGIARSCGGVAINLIVDNDVPKGSSILVPTLVDGRLRRIPVDFDDWRGEIPYEDWRVGDEARFASFPDRVRQVFDQIEADPLIDAFWPLAIRRRDDAATVALRFAMARREVEASWGVSNLELPLGRLCETDSFLWFASHLLAQLPRYQEVHNACLAEYRAAHRIRSRHHPVAALTVAGEWLEAPFWVWRGEHPRRRALLARQRPKAIDLRIAGEEEPFVTLPLSPDGEACCAVERLRELPARSIRLRTRALTTTMFARFFLGDLFIHGIGGAKYDELGDEISRRFLGIEPPAFLSMSLTLWLNLPREPVTPADLSEVERLARDFRFNPERHIAEPFPEAIRTYVGEKRAAFERTASSRGERLRRTTAIRRCNDAMQPWVMQTRGELEARKRLIVEGLRSNRIARNREFASVLHSESRLQQVLGGIEESIGAESGVVAGSL